MKRPIPVDMWRTEDDCSGWRLSDMEEYVVELISQIERGIGMYGDDERHDTELIEVDRKIRELMEEARKILELMEEAMDVIDNGPKKKKERLMRDRNESREEEQRLSGVGEEEREDPIKKKQQLMDGDACREVEVHLESGNEDVFGRGRRPGAVEEDHFKGGRLKDLFKDWEESDNETNMKGEGEGEDDYDEGNEDLDGRAQEQADEGFGEEDQDWWERAKARREWFDMFFEDSEEDENAQEPDDGFEDDEEADKELKNEGEGEWGGEMPLGDDRVVMREDKGLQGPWRLELDEADADLTRMDQDWGKITLNLGCRKRKRQI